MDIRIDTGFLTHHKTVKLQKRLGAEAVLCLVRLWCWCAENRPTGELVGMDTEDIEIVADWRGQEGVFTETLKSLKWLDDDGLHGWRERNPWAAGAPSRSDKARLSAMALRYPSIYQSYVEQGITGITKDEYQRVVAEYDAATTAGIISDSANDERTHSERIANANGALAPYPVPIPEPKTEVQKRSKSYTQVIHGLSTDLYTNENEGDLLFIDEWEFCRETGISEFEMTKIKARYGKELDLQVEFANLLNWTKSHGITIKNWVAYTKKWLEKVTKERLKN